MFKFKGLYAMYYRELHNMRGAWFTIITPFATSLLFLFLFGLSVGPLIGDVEYGGGSINYLLFFLPGVIGMGVVYSAMTPGGFLGEDKSTGALENLLSCPISRSAYILSKVSVAITLSTVQVFLILLLGMPLIGGFQCDNIFLILIAMILGAIFFCSIFVTFASIASPPLNGFILTLFPPLIMLCSSMFYSLENAPYWLRIAAYINPATYMTDVMRVGLIGGVFDHWMLMEVLILFLFSVASLIIATISVRRIHV